MSTQGRVPPDEPNGTSAELHPTPGEPDEPTAGPGVPRPGQGDRLMCRYDDHDIDQGQPARLVVTGTVDITTVDEFTTALDLAISLHPQGPGLLVDLRGLTLIGVAGVRALSRRQDAISEVLIASSGIVHRVLTMALLEHHLPIVADDPAKQPPPDA